MKIVVLVKQVPDSSLDRTLRSDDFTVDRESASNVINEIDENAIEAALALVEEHGGDVTLLTVGPDHATESIRKALSMGPDAAIHVVDDAIAGSCAVTTSKVLAAALANREYDLVLCGAESTDGGVQVMAQMLGARLGVAALSGARKITVDGANVTVERQTDDGFQTLAAATPAIVSVWDSANTPRYPSLKGIMAAKRKPVETLSLSDLGLSADEVGASAATSAVVSAEPRPPRAAGQRVTDEGEGGVALAQFLASEKFV
ncbi:MAG TPA: electron transfer flavoprotein subunit beta/FixA family protein [Stackebrandtia sp.]|jgi:electron transfer flavoprotein beta subunit|uniref:electron transfer flavoprotein subunit beta/FixA family protein n=1 Tax=Stackebrandtia sp. TaxID=2023065 RepID=UPI002D2CFA71|nr:electron transfer flavoprotein subunit beta/FixA family protein [Stackebrandtia sp.]HZE41976.1 electron transfer flavoprotein subunit beta/FixA family protein [Stackebrandtia sp.]